MPHVPHARCAAGRRRSRAPRRGLGWLAGAVLAVGLGGSASAQSAADAGAPVSSAAVSSAAVPAAPVAASATVRAVPAARRAHEGDGQRVWIERVLALLVGGGLPWVVYRLGRPGARPPRRAARADAPPSRRHERHYGPSA